VEYTVLVQDGVQSQVFLNATMSFGFKAQSYFGKPDTCKLFARLWLLLPPHVSEQDAGCALKMRSMFILHGTEEPGTCALYEKWSWQTFERTLSVT